MELHIFFSVDFFLDCFDESLMAIQCPTTIIPFFGDQPFWGERVHARGVGPPPIPVDEFSLDKLVGAINFMLDSKVPCLAMTACKALFINKVMSQI